MGVEIYTLIVLNLNHSVFYGTLLSLCPEINSILYSLARSSLGAAGFKATCNYRLDQFITYKSLKMF